MQNSITNIHATIKDEERAAVIPWYIKYLGEFAQADMSKNRMDM